MKVLGHRGCKYEIENTIRSFEKAFELGADGIELDTQSTLDNTIVVSHDENLKRVFGVDFKIREHTLFELESISKDGEKVPTLESVLEIAKSRSKMVDVELKNPKDLEAVAKIVQSFNYGGFFISSFYHRAMLEGKERFPKIKFAFLYAHVPEDVSLYAKKIDLLKPEIEFVTPEYRNYASITIPWTVNEKEDFEKLYDLNVFAVISDYPDKIIEFLKEKT
ncbi:glycerophosphodiester phosphodiesterase [Caldisericum exile]|uniref:Glycerophosphoryl diester phosphodiesterase n=1 Tax=Caldisericum exile (strain DSM 21853 / NBRC 104410 / AZM16c01) TaxID=511051 RepID=A0A7U6GDZ7_CALEA|nr:glycerophosphodiester phosphodiesterase family protein [Caldisericum exile]BAL80653.1 putative glycerophosphoryl diester phosphodiesterase [Caldisericum exile AZM16c01]